MSDDELDTLQKKVFAAVIIAIIGGNAGFILNKSSSDARHDPYTGTRGSAAEDRIDRIDAIQQTMLYRMAQREKVSEQCVKRLNDHLRHHN